MNQPWETGYEGRKILFLLYRIRIKALFNMDEIKNEDEGVSSEEEKEETPETSEETKEKEEEFEEESEDE
ncbi:hypothetical protein ACFL1O_00110 [Patescibacteria group bacterium]